MVATMDHTLAVVSQLPAELVQDCIDRITGSPGSSEWSISNKYYSAQVQVRRFASLDGATGAPAIILLIDGEGAPEKALHLLADMEPPEVALVAGHYRGRRTTVEQIESCTSVCIDRGWEYVPLDTSWEGADPEDMDGIGRLREATQARVWSNTSESLPSTSFMSELSAGFDDDFAPFQSAHVSSSDIGDLFQQLQGLRAQAELITDLDKRRQFAAKVAQLVESQLDDDDAIFE